MFFLALKKIFYKLTEDTLTLMTVEWHYDFKYWLNYEYMNLTNKGTLYQFDVVMSQILKSVEGDDKNCWLA